MDCISLSEVERIVGIFNTNHAKSRLSIQ